MFTGIITAVGRITSVEPFVGAADHGVRLWIDAPAFDLHDLKIGDSIAINGACMTAVALQPHGFAVDVSRESLNRTVGLDRVGVVNLERSMRLGDSIDGHLVSGHIDGIGRVAYFAPVGESYELRVSTSLDLAPFLAYKGSLAVHGVSLTVNQVHDLATGCEVSINIIPHTFEHTTLRTLSVGDGVNLEVDPLARYVARILTVTALRGPAAQTARDPLAV